MAIAATRIGEHLRAHWFFLAAAIVAAGDYLVSSTLERPPGPRVLEASILLDLSLVIPALYFWCYRARGRAALVRAVALSCLGIWLAGHIVPVEHHRILKWVGFVRYIGLAVLLAVELKLGLMIYRAAFQRDDAAAPTALNAARDAGMPEWVVRLMAWEAALWHRAWQALRRVFSRW